MKVNPFYDAWLFLSGNTDEHRASGVGWLLVALFLALVAATIWIAIVNWRQDPAQRTNGHLATWFMRVMIGVMFYQGSIWKHLAGRPLASATAAWPVVARAQEQIC